MYEPLLNPSRSIRNKADAMQFAILVTMKHNGCGEPITVNYDDAEKLFKFFCDHVEFTKDDQRWSSFILYITHKRADFCHRV